mgnify:CR=1 FL=1
MPLNFGLIGCGRVAPRHAQSLEQVREARLVAVADIRADRAQHFAEEYRAEAHLDYCELLARSDVEAVSICVPSGLHAQVTVDALAAGKHVLVEKPIALNLADADRMIAAAREKGLTLGVVLQNRYNSPMQQLRRLVDEVAKVRKCRNPASGPQEGRGGTSRLLSRTEWVTRPNQPSVLVRIVSPVILLHNEVYENKEHPDHCAG